MTDLTPSERDALTSALHDGREPPSTTELAALAERAGEHARAQRTRRRTGVTVVVAASVAAVFVVPALLRGGADPAPEPADSDPAASGDPSPGSDLPADCTASDHTEPAFLLDDPEWIRFCPGEASETRWAQMPADVIEPDAAFLAAWREGGPVYRCAADGPDFRVQVGLADESVGALTGDTICDYSWLYDALMRAYGRYYADQFDPTTEAVPFTCPSGPADVHAVDRDGASANLQAGVAMPLTATHGWFCSWNAPTTPEEHGLTPAQAEAIRVQMHAVPPAPDSCTVNERGPSYVVVLQDRTDTRRAMAIRTSDCGSGIGVFQNTVSSAFANGPHGLWPGPVVPE
jgi:hypothetical protein